MCHFSLRLQLCRKMSSPDLCQRREFATDLSVYDLTPTFDLIGLFPANCSALLHIFIRLVFKRAVRYFPGLVVSARYSLELDTGNNSGEYLAINKCWLN